MKWKAILFSIVVITLSIIGRAAPQGTLTSNNTDSLWAHFPWIWTIGGGIFIMLFLRILRTKQQAGDNA